MIKNLLALCAFFVLVFAVVGWYLDWYRVESSTNEDGGRSIQIDFNNPKITEDLNTGKEKLRKILATDEDQKEQGSGERINTTKPNTTPPGANQEKDFWFDNEKTFVYPKSPQVPTPTPPTLPPGFTPIEGAPVNGPQLPPLPKSN